MERSTTEQNAGPKKRFGVFEFDPQAREVTKHGVRLKLQEQPAQILAALLEQAGQIVPREELRRRLWPDGTFVDYEQSLNKAVNKLRDALGDSAAKPIYIETVARRGYRFVAPVEVDRPKEAEPPKEAERPIEDPARERNAAPEAAAQPQLHTRLFSLVAVILVAAVVLYQVWNAAGLFRTSSAPALPKHTQITFVGDATFPAISPDGNFVAYVTGGMAQGQKLMLQDLKGGQAIELSAAMRMSSPRWSPDGAELAAYRQVPSKEPNTLLTPRLGGPARLMAGGDFPCWSPDGSQFAVSWEDEMGFRIVDKVTGSVKRVHLSGFSWNGDADWSRASNLLAFAGALENGGGAIWTVRPDGSQQRKVIEEDGLASPRWSPAGDAIYFLRASQGETQNLLKVGIDPKSGQAKGPPLLLWSGQQAGDYFTLTADGMRLAYTRCPHSSNLWLAQFQSPDNGKTLGKELHRSPLTRGTARFDMPSISPDGKWIAFVSGGHIYKMTMEGGTSIQLTFSNGADVSPAWSPDGKRIAFGSHEGGTHKVWIMDADGANRRQFENTRLAVDSDAQVIWSPGRNILYQKPLNRNYGVLDPETGAEKPLVQNESVGWLFVPKYSPDGKKVAVDWNRRGQAGIWVISLIDNSQTFLWGVGRFPAGWSPDGGSIYAYRGNNVLSIPARGASRGAPQPFLTAPGEFGGYAASIGLACQGCVSVSPDGTKFVFSAGETTSDVWVVDNFDTAIRK